MKYSDLKSNQNEIDFNIEEIYSSLLNNLADEVQLWRVVRDDSGKIINWKLLDVNPTTLKAWKKVREEVIGKTSSEIFGDETVQQYLPIVEKIMQSGKPLEWEDHFAPTNQYLKMKSIPLGEYFISTGEDISERKQSERKYKTIFQYSSVAKIIADEQGRYLNVNKKACTLLGYSHDELINMGVSDVVSANRDSVKSSYDSFKQKGDESGEVELITKKGEVRVAEYYSKKIDDNLYLSTLIDITEKKEAERALKESQRMLQFAESIAKQGSWRYHIKNNEWSFSKNWLKLFGFEKEPTADELNAKVDPRDLPEVNARFLRAIEEKTIYKAEHRIIINSEETKWVRVIAKLAEGENGEADAILMGTSQDITAEKKADKALKESEDFLNRTGEIAKVGGWQVKEDFKKPFGQKGHTTFTNYLMIMIPM